MQMQSLLTLRSTLLFQIIRDRWSRQITLSIKVRLQSPYLLHMSPIDSYPRPFDFTSLPHILILLTSIIVWRSDLFNCIMPPVIFLLHVQIFPYAPSSQTYSTYARLQVLMAACIKFKVFWDVAPCSLGVERRFRGAYCLHQGDRPGDGGTTHLLNVGLLQRYYTALHLRRL
jgi:hypothetical protein